MVRLRILLGVASSLVAVAALTIVFAGSGEAQGNGTGLPNGPNVTVVNTPLPVTGNVTATMTGNVDATVVNTSNNPVPIRDVGAKTLWQESRATVVNVGDGASFVEFTPVPAGKALVVEHVNHRFVASDPASFGGADFLRLGATGAPPPGFDAQFFVPQQTPIMSITDVATKYYVVPGATFQVTQSRLNATGTGGMFVTATGYLVDYP
jgi:hypothetical protein